MISEEKKKAILAKIGKDKEAVAMMNKRDIQGLIAKCKNVGFDVTEGDITEFVVGSTGELSDDELNAVSAGSCGDGGTCDDLYVYDGWLCADGSCTL